MLKEILIFLIIVICVIMPASLLIHESIHLLQYDKMGIKNDGIQIKYVQNQQSFSGKVFNGWIAVVQISESDEILKGLQIIKLQLLASKNEFEAYAIQTMYVTLMGGLLYVLLFDEVN